MVSLHHEGKSACESEKFSEIYSIGSAIVIELVEKIF